jgi:transposase
VHSQVLQQTLMTLDRAWNDMFNRGFGFPITPNSELLTPNSGHLCQGAKLIFVEDIDFKAWAKGMFGKHTLDAGFGQFFNILAYISWKKDVFFAKVDKDYTSQTCPNCGCHTGKKLLKERIHHLNFKKGN